MSFRITRPSCRVSVRLGAAIVAAIASLVVDASLASRAEAAYWGPFKKQCTGDGVAKYSAILKGIPFGQSWERACANMGAVINGRRIARPTKCVNTRAAMWGEFVVQDNACRRPKAALRWGTFKDNGCVAYEGRGWGMRSYSSVLWGIPPGQSWEATCARMPAQVAGRSFSHPTACVKADLKDAAKVVRVVAKQVARVAKHSKHPKIYLAAKGTALVAKIMETVNPALNIWGVFYVEDRRCPDFR